MTDLAVGDVLEHWTGALRLVVTGFADDGRVICDRARIGEDSRGQWDVNPTTLTLSYFKVGSLLR